MSSFRDHAGDDWTLVVTYGSASAVQRETGVNITLVSKDQGWIDVLFSDPGKLVGVLWVLCQAQAETRGVTAEQFGYRFDGPTLEAAGESLANAIAGFFPRTRIAKAIQEGLTTSLREAEDRIIQSMSSTDSASVSNSPASPASIPAG